jgi:hypothetical protein
MADPVSRHDVATLTYLYRRIRSTYEVFMDDPYFDTYARLGKAIVQYVDYRESLK